MIAYLEELMAKIFGVRDEIAIPVRVDEDDRRPGERQLKGRK
ncbi:hypothetical protein Z945_2405 [Sulfitobacter noctilucae]|nr:hypothetical protein [Sulfitobacter noctilucae]KIN61413.1 hypothetical protein Z945_2405 [Sulfitobacter noctilucae]